MRAVLVLIALSGACVHRMPLSGQEQCATRGMVLTGLTMNSGVATGYAQAGNTQAWAVGRSYDESVSCRMPETQAELCSIAVHATSAQQKGEYSPFPRNLLIGAGYFAFILPGLILYALFDNERDGKIGELAVETFTGTQRCWAEDRPAPRDPGTTRNPFVE